MPQPDHDQPLIVMWGSKGGAGTTVTAAATAITDPNPVLLVDLDGDTADVLGVPVQQLGVRAWLASDAEPDRLIEYIEPVADGTSLLQAGLDNPDQGRHRPERLAQLATWLRAQERTVIVDAGTGPPAAELAAVADTSVLVTRNDYVALTNAVRFPTRPDEIVLVQEPYRALRANDVEAALRAPVTATIEPSPQIARAVDAGLFIGKSKQRIAAAAATVADHHTTAPAEPEIAAPVSQPELDYGYQWRSRHTDDQHRVSYNPGTRILYAINTSTQDIEALGTFQSPGDVDAALDGWADRHATPDGFDWMRTQLGLEPVEQRIDISALMKPPSPGMDTDRPQPSMQLGLNRP